MLNEGMTASQAQEILDSISYYAGWTCDSLCDATQSSKQHSLLEVVCAVRTLADMMAAQIGPLERFLEDGTMTDQLGPLAGWLATQR